MQKRSIHLEVLSPLTYAWSRVSEFCPWFVLTTNVDSSGLPSVREREEKSEMLYLRRR